MTIATSHTPATPPAVLSAEVQAFAESEGVSEYLPKLIELVRSLSPEDTRLNVFLEEDPEVPDDRHIVLELEGVFDAGRLEEADRRWYDGLMRICPSRYTCVFRHSYRPAS